MRANAELFQTLGVLSGWCDGGLKRSASFEDCLSFVCGGFCFTLSSVEVTLRKLGIRLDLFGKSA